MTHPYPTATITEARAWLMVESAFGNTDARDAYSCVVADSPMTPRATAWLLACVARLAHTLKAVWAQLILDTYGVEVGA